MVWSKPCLWYDVVDTFGQTQRVQGTWERDVAQWLTERGINWETCRRKASGHWMPLSDGTTYIPDFYLFGYDVYLDPKIVNELPRKMSLLEAEYPGRVYMLGLVDGDYIADLVELLRQLEAGEVTRGMLH